MPRNLRSAFAVLLCATSMIAASPATAGPVSAANAAITGPTTQIEPVYYRRYYGHRYYPRGYYRGYNYNPGAAVAAGAALGLLGAGVAAASRPYYGYGYPPYGYYAYPPYGGYYGW